MFLFNLREFGFDTAFLRNYAASVASRQKIGENLDFNLFLSGRELSLVSMNLFIESLNADISNVGSINNNAFENRAKPSFSKTSRSRSIEIM